MDQQGGQVAVGVETYSNFDDFTIYKEGSPNEYGKLQADRCNYTLVNIMYKILFRSF